MQGSVRRVDGTYGDDPHAADSATFVSTPYVVLRERQRQTGPNSMESLVSFHHNYDVGEKEDRKQVLPQSQRSFGEEIVNIAHLGCLVLGSGAFPSISCLRSECSLTRPPLFLEVLITWGEVEMSALCKDSIVVEEIESYPPVMIKITDDTNVESVSYIQHDASFAVSIPQDWY